MTRPAPRLRALTPFAAMASVTIAALLSGCSTTAPSADDAGQSPSAERSAETSAPFSSPAATAAPATAAPATHWEYSGDEGPDHWGELASTFSTCGTGTAQSPIDLSSTAEPEDDDLVLAYGPVDEDPTDTGHTLQLDVGAGAGLTYGGVDYTLLQLHYHDPSEHTIDGAPAPVEFHFVNQDADGNLLVVGVLGVAGEHNESFEPLVAAAASGAVPTPTTVDVPAMLPSSLSHYAYEGSLTTPPCTEHVQWLVMDTPVELGQDQIDTLEARYSGTNRPVQPLNGREVHSADE